jgi:hypothetical protein
MVGGKGKRVAKKSDAQVAAETEAAERKKVRKMPHVDHEYHARGPHLPCMNYMTSLTSSTTFVHYSLQTAKKGAGKQDFQKHFDIVQ